MKWREIIKFFTITFLSAIFVLIMFFTLRSKVDIEPTSFTVKTSAGEFEIPNFAPKLVLNIPSQTWYEDSSKNNAFDLDSYFTDDNGDIITYNVSGNSNINVIIDPNTNVVSFSHPNGWTGIEYVVFTAKSQGSSSTNSNNITLTVEPVEEVVTPVTGGGGAAAPSAVPKKVSDFKLDKNFIKISARQGETVKKSLKISNTGDTLLNINVDLENLGRFMLFPQGISKYDFELEPGESKTIQLVFDFPLDIEPGIYSEEILITGDSTKKTVKVLIEIESEKPLFDVDVEIPYEYQKVLQGENVLVEIILYNLRGFGRFDVKVDYFIIDLDGNSLVSEHETIAVETQASFVRSLRLPSDIELGDYLFYVKVSYEGFVGSGSDLFEVKSEVKEPIMLAPKKEVFTLINILVSLLLLMTVALVIDRLISGKRERMTRLKEKIRPIRKKIIRKV